MGEEVYVPLNSSLWPWELTEPEDPVSLGWDGIIYSINDHAAQAYSKPGPEEDLLLSRTRSLHCGKVHLSDKKDKQTTAGGYELWSSYGNHCWSVPGHCQRGEKLWTECAVWWQRMALPGDRILAWGWGLTTVPRWRQAAGLVSQSKKEPQGQPWSGRSQGEAVQRSDKWEEPDQKSLQEEQFKSVMRRDGLEDPLTNPRRNFMLILRTLSSNHVSNYRGRYLQCCGGELVINWKF